MKLPLCAKAGFKIVYLKEDFGMPAIFADEVEQYLLSEEARKQPKNFTPYGSQELVARNPSDSECATTREEEKGS